MRADTTTTEFQIAIRSSENDGGPIGREADLYEFGYFADRGEAIAYAEAKYPPEEGYRCSAIEVAVYEARMRALQGTAA